MASSIRRQAQPDYDLGGGGSDPPPNRDNTGCSSCDSPIVLNLGTGNYQTSPIDDPALFDVDADGMAERITWTARGTPMAFLALDRNGNGGIDNGSELFGNHTPLASGRSASNGFAALAEYDANGDSVIDSRDAVWKSLVLWTDANHDGISEMDELQPISSSKVEAVSLSYHFSGRTDPSGNVYRYGSTFVVDGHVRPCYDIFFRRVQ